MFYPPENIYVKYKIIRMLLSPFCNNFFLLPASHMQSACRAGEPSNNNGKLSDMFISFYLWTLIFEYVNDEGFIVFLNDQKDVGRCVKKGKII